MKKQVVRRETKVNKKRDGIPETRLGGIMEAVRAGEH